MKKKSNLKYRILFVVLVVAVFLVVHFYPCIMLNFSSLPETITKSIPGNSKDILILYGPGLCSSCPPGHYLGSLKGRTDLLFVVPPEFNEYDIKNLKDVFTIQSQVIKGDEELVKLLKRVRGCKGLETWRMNYHVKTKENGKPGPISIF